MVRTFLFLIIALFLAPFRVVQFVWCRATGLRIGRTVMVTGIDHGGGTFFWATMVAGFQVVAIVAAYTTTALRGVWHRTTTRFKTVRLYRARTSQVPIVTSGMQYDVTVNAFTPTRQEGRAWHLASISVQYGRRFLHLVTSSFRHDGHQPQHRCEAFAV